MICTRFGFLDNRVDDASVVHLQHATESSVHFRLNTLLEKKDAKMTAGYGAGKFQELIFAYDSSPFSCPLTLFSSEYLPSSLLALRA